MNLSCIIKRPIAPQRAIKESIMAKYPEGRIAQRQLDISIANKLRNDTKTSIEPKPNETHATHVVGPSPKSLPIFTFRKIPKLNNTVPMPKSIKFNI